MNWMEIFWNSIVLSDLLNFLLEFFWYAIIFVLNFGYFCTRRFGGFSFNFLVSGLANKSQEHSIKSIFNFLQILKKNCNKLFSQFNFLLITVKSLKNHSIWTELCFWICNFHFLEKSFPCKTLLSGSYGKVIQWKKLNVNFK